MKWRYRPDHGDVLSPCPDAVEQTAKAETAITYSSVNSYGCLAMTYVKDKLEKLVFNQALTAVCLRQYKIDNNYNDIGRRWHRDKSLINGNITDT